VKRRDFLFAVAFVVPTSHAEQLYVEPRRDGAPRDQTRRYEDRGDPNYAIVFEEMQRLGYVEGVNMIVDRGLFCARERVKGLRRPAQTKQMTLG
jgi:hypothetical protein